MTEQRLIDAYDLWSDIMMLPHNGDIISSEEVEQAIKDAPTVDAMEVVRCKDCKHYLPHPRSERKCCYVHITTPHFMLEDGFCSYGERRTDNEA